MIKPDAWEHLLHDLRRDEGFRSEAYLDTEGVWTIGYGFTEGVRLGDRITQTEADQYLIQRAQEAVKDARLVLGSEMFDGLDGPRQAVLANMAYNLGATRLAKFVNSLRLIREGKYEQAAVQLRASRWCVQVKSRCHRLTDSMRTGQFVTH